jgi:hypothetical protein
VEVSLGAPLSRLCSFACWLPKHAALVSSISIKPPFTRSNSDNVDGLQWGLHLEAAQQLLQQAIQTATALPAAAAWSNTAAAALQQQQKQSVRLRNISSITMAGDAAMLHALPAHSLTHLSLQWLPCSSGGCTTASSAFVKLSNLQQLHIQVSHFIGDPSSFWAGVAQLSRLTSLELDIVDKDVEQMSTRFPNLGIEPEIHGQALQQLLAQPLPLHVLRLTSNRPLPRLNLSQLKQLHVFSGSCSSDWAEQLDAIFPPQLQQLEVDYEINSTDVDALLELKQLQCLKVAVICEEPPDLQRLTQLSALQHLSLTYDNFMFFYYAAGEWPQLSQLCELAVKLEDEPPSKQQWQTIIDDVAACTNLTSLQLEATCWEEENEDAEDYFGEPVAVCAKLAGLQKLKHLRFEDDSTLAPGDALALTALTGLTSLVLARVGSGVGDEAAAAIAGSCRQLRHLDLYDCDLVSMECLSNIRHLTQLTQLQLRGNVGLTQQQLTLLSGLTCLQQLGVDRTAEITEGVVDSFWAAVRGQL